MLGLPTLLMINLKSFNLNNDSILENLYDLCEERAFCFCKIDNLM